MTSIMRFDKWENSLGVPHNATLQVLSSTKTNVFSKTGTTETDIPGLTVTIVPKQNNSKFFIFANVNISGSASSWVWLSLYRNSIPIGFGSGGTSQNKTFVTNLASAIGTEIYPVSFSYLDTPNTDQSITYKITINQDQAAAVSKVNQRGSDTSLATISTITVMEIAQ